MLWMVSSAAPLHAAYDSSDGNFYLMTTDGNEKYTVDGTITFKTYGSRKPSYRDCGVTFTPKNPGEVIVATIEKFDFPYGAALLVWDKDIDNVRDKIGIRNASTTTYSYMPEGWSALYTSDSPAAPGTMLTSNDASGALSFGFHCGSFSTEGFTITVSSISPKDMEWVGAELSAPAEPLYRGLKDQVLATVDITVDGGGNPFVLNAIDIDCSALAPMASGLRLSSSEKADDASLIATADATGKISYTSTDRTLRSGVNKFYIIGSTDVAFTGTYTMPTVTVLTAGGETRNVNASAATPTVANSILMPASNLVYTIDDNAARFYDPGGPAGTIPEGFTGSVTFVPATPGYKIKVDITSLDLFNTSSTGKNDIFKFYNGRTADDENLIAELLKETKIVKSTAEDGSLTVTLTSTTGVPKGGWEAIVSQFIPGDMTFDGADVQTAGTTEISSYQSRVPMAYVNLRATNTLNPITVSGLGLNIKGAAALKKIELYAVGEKKELTFTTPVGTLSATADGQVNVPVTGMQLLEGSNYILITADIADNVLNDTELSLTPTDVYTSAGQKAMEQAVTVSVKNVNRFNHVKGTQTRDIHDDWIFASTPDKTSSSKYTLEDADCIVTFIPDDGKVAQIDFSKFDVYYAASSYGTRAVFEIYSGREANADNLLWALTDNSQQKTGPGRTLRSTAADGSLTVKFNAKTTSSYNAGSGWLATVTPFLNHDMTVESVTVSQTSAATTMPGATLQPMLQADILTEGTLDTRRLQAVTVNLKESAPSVSAVHVTVDGSSVASADISADAASATITLPQPIALAEGINTIGIAYDIRSDAVADGTVDCALTSITTDAGRHEVAQGDPEGVCTVKYQYLMTKDDNSVITVTSPIHFYDDGGPDGNLTMGLKGTLTFKPGIDGKVIRLSVNSYNTPNNAPMTIYHGTGTDNDNLAATYKGKLSTTTPDLPIVSKADDGAITVSFTSPSSSYLTYEGWDITVECYLPSDIHLASVNNTPPAHADVVRGTENAPISASALKFEGDAASAQVKKVNISLEGTSDLSAIADLTLWDGGKYDAFTPGAKVLARIEPAQQTSVELSEPYEVSEIITKYLYLTAGISDQAAPGSTIKAVVTSVEMADGTVVEAVSADGIGLTVVNGFEGGEFVIGSSATADYPTFAEAYKAMGTLIEGPVTFKFEPGTYAEDIHVKDIRGTSATNPITITSLTGNAEDVIITGKGYSKPSAYNDYYGVITIEATEHVNINNITIKPKNDSYEHYTILARGASRYLTVENCVFDQKLDLNTSDRSIIGTRAIPDTNGTNADFITVRGNHFIGGGKAVRVEGSCGYIAYDKLHGILVENNICENQGSRGIYLQSADNVVVRGNTISTTADLTKTNYMGIDIYRCTGIVDIEANRIRIVHDKYAGGIQLRENTHGTAERPIRVFNNAIAFTNSATANASYGGMVIAADVADIDIAHNSISLTGATGQGIYFSSNKETLKNVRVANNLINLNLTTPAASFPIRILATGKVGEFKFSNNCLFSKGGNISNIAADKETWATATGDNSLIVEEPSFFNAYDLHLRTAGSLVSASRLDWVTNDADGKVRDTDTPTIGAYEYADIPEGAPLIAEGYPTVSSITCDHAVVTSKWNQTGRLYTIVREADAEAPTADEMLTSTLTADASADNELSVSLKSLTRQTTYKVYLLLDGVLGEKSEVVASAPFTTLRFIADLTASVNGPEDSDVNDIVSLEAVAEGGDAPYTYIWTDQTGARVGDERDLSFTATEPQQYTLTVTSADGQSVTKHYLVKVYGSNSTARFEDNALPDDSYWWSNLDSDSKAWGFYSGGFWFNNSSMKNPRSWSGFALSTCTATDFTSLFPGQFHNTVGSGDSDSRGFAVCYAYSPVTFETLESRDGSVIDYVMLANSAYFYHSASQGDGFTDPFGPDDYLKVTFTGDDPTGVPVEYQLATYDNGLSAAEGWNKVDLRPLGTVKKVNVHVTSSNDLFPSYVCLDNMTYASKTTSVENIRYDLTDDPVSSFRIISIDGRVIAASDIDDLRDALGRLAPGCYVIDMIHVSGAHTSTKINR